MGVNTLKYRFSHVEVLDNSITLADIDAALLGKVDVITGPSPTGGARQSYTPGEGGTLKIMRPGYGYEVLLKEGVATYDLAGVRPLYGPVTTTTTPTTTPTTTTNSYAQPGYMQAGYAQ